MGVHLYSAFIVMDVSLNESIAVVILFGSICYLHIVDDQEMHKLFVVSASKGYK